MFDFFHQPIFQPYLLQDDWCLITKRYKMILHLPFCQDRLIRHVENYRLMKKDPGLHITEMQSSDGIIYLIYLENRAKL